MLDNHILGLIEEVFCLAFELEHKQQHILLRVHLKIKIKVCSSFLFDGRNL